MITIDNVLKKYDDNVVFDGLTMKILDGEFVVFSGESGSGKTTLLNMIGGIEKYDRGEIIVDNFNLTKHFNRLNYFRTKVGFLFQNFALSENKTVLSNMNMLHSQCAIN